MSEPDKYEYEKIFNGNEYTKEVRNRFYIGVIGTVYVLYKNGEFCDEFKKLRDLKQQYPTATRKKD